jgi:acetyl-CoA acetyltransferase
MKINYLTIAEHISQVYGVSREEQDKFAFSSQMKYKNAFENNCFKDEIGKLFLKNNRMENLDKIKNFLGGMF